MRCILKIKWRFLMYTAVYHILLPGKFLKFIRDRKRISYKKIGLTQCMNIINGGITKCKIMYDQIPGLPMSISFVRRHFQLKSFQVINPKMIPMGIARNIEECQWRG